MAKTQDEFAAYNAAAALTDPARKKKRQRVCDEISGQRVAALLYKSVMGAYQQANNADKMMDMAREVFTYDADDPDALLGVAQGWPSGRGIPTWIRTSGWRKLRRTLSAP